MREVRPVCALVERPKAWRLDRKKKDGKTEREKERKRDLMTDSKYRKRATTISNFHNASGHISRERGKGGGAKRGAHSQNLSLTWRQLAIGEKGVVKRTQSCHWHIRQDLWKGAVQGVLRKFSLICMVIFSNLTLQFYATFNMRQMSMSLTL